MKRLDAYALLPFEKESHINFWRQYVDFSESNISSAEPVSIKFIRFISNKILTNRFLFHPLDDYGCGELSTYVMLASIGIDKINDPRYQRMLSTYQLSNREHVMITFELNVFEMAELQQYLDRTYQDGVPYCKVIQLS